MASEVETTPTPKTSTSQNDGPKTATVADPKLVASDQLPSAETCHQVGNYTVLDREGSTVPFKDLYSGADSTRRVLVIFIRHFFCGVSFSPACFKSNSIGQTIPAIKTVDEK
jgi:hypothetical protein